MSKKELKSMIFHDGYNMKIFKKMIIFFIWVTLWKLSKIEQKSMIFHRVTQWKLSKIEQKSMFFHRGYPMKIVKKRTKIDDFSCWLQYENFQKNDDIFMQVKFWIQLRPSKCHEIFENLQKHWFVPRSPELLLGIGWYVPKK